MPNDNPPIRPLFPYLPKNQAGPTFNRFLRPLREGVTSDPSDIVQRVIREIKEDLRRRGSWNFAPDVTPLRQVLLAILAHPSDALALAAEAVAYRRMPPEALAAHKATREADGRRIAMGHKPPSLKQLAYLRGLGCATAPATMLEAHDLIDARKGSRHA